jgi:hypothetical protein
MCHQIIDLQKINGHNLYAMWHQIFGPKNNWTRLVCHMEFYFFCHVSYIKTIQNG